MEEFIQPLWWFAGMLICTAIFELLNGSFKQELNKLFKGWDSSLHDIISNEHSTELYWDLVDLHQGTDEKIPEYIHFFFCSYCDYGTPVQIKYKCGNFELLPGNHHLQICNIQ